MCQNIFLFGFWDIPVSDYWLFYLGLGVLGFILCYFHRLFILAAIPVLIWFTVSDFSGFYRYQVSPDNNYVFQVSIAILASLSMSFIGAYLNWRKLEKLN